MEYPSGEGLPDAAQEQPEFYEKDKGAAGIHGQIFELKFCALLFVRAINKGYKFKLASNAKGYGAFDDVVVEYLDASARKSHIFLQLKSKKSQHITKQQLLAEKGDFSLRKYFKCYTEIEERFNCSEGVKIDGRIDESLFVIYTNADVAQDLKSNKDAEVSEEEFLMTGGSVLQFNEQEHKAIYEHLQELSKHREFLSRFRIFYSQADEKEMDCHIKPELQQIMSLRETELELAYMCFTEFMKDWWQNSHCFLKDTNCKENDPLRKTSEKVKTALVAKILDQRKYELDELGIEYKETAILDMKQLIESHQALLIFAPGHTTTLTAAKIHQTLSATEHIILNLQQLVRYKTEVILAWKHSFNVMVLEGDRSAEDFEDIFNDVAVTLNEHGAEKRFIFISSRMGTIQQTSALRRIFRTKLTEMYVVWKFTDIVTESRMFFLEKKIYFQGTEIKLGDIVKENGVGMLNTLDPDSAFLLLENEKPSIGSPTEDAVEYYIDRRLQCRKDVKPRSPLQDQIPPALSGDTLQEKQRVSPYREENLERETNRVWKPSTLLDSGERVILVTDEPGMGKSTLLTHLAKETRQSHPDTWIVRININNHTSILEEMKTNGYDEKGAIKLLTEAAKVKETEGSLLEGMLFRYTYSSTGNMAVLIDGVDEVSPHYIEEVLEILKFLSITDIKRIWVTSRNSVKDLLEEELQCQSYALVPFNEEDQKSLLLKFWNKKCPNAKQKDVENLTNRVVELSMEHLTVGDTNFMGLPLHSMLLAEMFEENLKQCSTSGTVELPEYINLVKLYDLYVKKKWDIYLSDKMLFDQTNVSARKENAALHEHFIHNHMAAALVAILTTNHLQKFAGNTIAEKSKQFVQKIEEGVEKTGIIINVIEGRPVFQHRTLAEYFVARWLCENMLTSQTFMRDHIFESGFGAVRSMVDRILADKCPLHEAVLNSNLLQVKTLLLKEISVSEKDGGERTSLHIAVSYKNLEIIMLLLEHGADVTSVDTLLGLSPVDYASRMDDWEMLSLMMEKRSDIREHVLNGAKHDYMDHTASAIRAAAKYGRNDLLQYLIDKGNAVNMALPGDNSTLLHEAARGQQTETVKILVQMEANTDSKDVIGKTPLHVSVETANLEVINSIVESQKAVQRQTEVKGPANLETATYKGNLLNVGDIDGNTPLHLAAATGNTSIVSYLVSAGSDLNACNIQGEYPLAVAARCGKNDVVNLFLNGDSYVKCEEAKIDALRAAIVARRLDMTDLLLRLGVPVNKGENEQPIHTASRMGHKEIVSLLLQHDARLESRTYSGNTALHLASEAGHMDLVKDLVERQGDDVNSLNFEKETPLHLAARNGREHLVKYFIEKGCSIDSTSASGATCLHVACENGHYTTVENLLKHSAGVNARNSANQTPLHIAASRGHTKIVELLSLHNVNFSLRDRDGITALLAASRKGHTDTVRYIVQHGGNIEDTDGKGNTIAHFAVANENCDILNFVSKQNIKLDVQNIDGDTPLLQAVREGRNLVVQCLLETHSDVNTQGNDGMRPLDVADLSGNIELTRLLLERNARSGKAGMHIVIAAKLGFLDILQSFIATGDETNVTNEDGESPLHVACKSGQVATVQYLSGRGSLLQSQDNCGNTALHVAVSNGHLDVTRVLVGRGANLAVANASGSTALHIAANGGYFDIIRLLADCFAPIDMRNVKKQTALLVAATQGHDKIVRFLIEQGAGVAVRDIEGKTALNIATENGYGVIAQLLKDREEGRFLVRSICHTDLHTAAKRGKSEILKRTENDGASLDKTTETQKHRSNTHSAKKLRTLRTEAENGNFEEVQRLLEAGAALDYCDTFGRTALWGAASRGHKPIIRILLESGSCANIPDSEGVTPIDIAAGEGQWLAFDEFLMHDQAIRTEGAENIKNQLHTASETGNVEVVRKILKCGISVNTANKDGNTLLHAAAKYGHKVVCQILLSSGANVNLTDNRGNTPLKLAVENGHVEIFRELLSAKGIQECRRNPLPAGSSEHVRAVQEPLNRYLYVDIVDNNVLTPLIPAAEEGHVGVVRGLLNHAASGEFSFQELAQYLCTSAKNGHVELVRELLNQGTGVDVANNEGSTSLNIAASEGQLEVVRELLNQGARVEIANYNGCTPLHTAASEGRLEVVRELLNRGASLCVANNDGSTSLHIAAFKGHLEVVREFLNHGASVDIANNNNGFTPLNIAVSEGHLEVVRELLNHGAGVYAANDDGLTSLHIAAFKGHLEVVRELLNHGANVDIANNNNGCTPLNIAVSEGQLEVVRELLNHGASVHVANDDGFTSLHVATLKGHVEVVRELLNHGNSVEIANNKNGCTPLNIAVSEGRLEVVRELLNHGASVNIANNKGVTSLHTAVSKSHLEVVRELLKHGASVDIANNEGWTALYVAASEGHVEVVRELLKHNASVDIANKEIWTPLYVAASEGHVEVVSELLNHNAGVDIVNNNGWTPLNKAASEGHLEVVRELLNHGASVDIANNKGCTPLYTAALKRHVEVVRELLNRGANVDIPSNNGWTALNKAIAKGHLEVVRELLNHGASVDIANNDV